jgi:uncharacterized protein YqjF (DUF2071 family)
MFDVLLGRAAGLSEASLAALPAVDEFRQQATLRETAHRPWPLPDRPWFMGQTWCDLLFAHWRVRREDFEEVVPPQLPLDTFDGSPWIGVTPFLVTGARLRGIVPLPLASRFPEVNVRTYVTVDGKPGIYFLSLDAARRMAVATARRYYRLPYFLAEMDRSAAGGSVEFSSHRTSADGPPADLEGRCMPIGSPCPPAPGTREPFLTERYCLYALDDDGRILRGDIHHPPWPLQRATAELEVNTMAEPCEIELSSDPVFHFARRQDVALWRLAPID